MTRGALREAHPIGAGAVLCGAVGGGVWLLVFGLISATLRGFLEWILLACASAWLAAYVLAQRGDRGVAAGVAAAAGVAWAVTVVFVVIEWVRLGVWPVR